MKINSLTPEKTFVLDELWILAWGASSYSAPTMGRFLLTQMAAVAELGQA